MSQEYLERTREFIRQLQESGGGASSADSTSRDEAILIARKVEEQGYVLVWSSVLEDTVAFYNTDEDRVKIPPGFVPYSTDELKELFGEPQSSPNTNALRLIHQAKKLRGRVQPS